LTGVLAESIASNKALLLQLATKAAMMAAMAPRNRRFIPVPSASFPKIDRGSWPMRPRDFDAHPR
jgi:hypothetical protein